MEAISEIVTYQRKYMKDVKSWNMFDYEKEYLIILWLYILFYFSS